MDFQDMDERADAIDGEETLAEGFQELSFDDVGGDADDFMAEFRRLPDVDEESGVRHNPFLRIAYGRKLLSYEQERELGRRLHDGRTQMTEALAAFVPCAAHLVEQWERAVAGERPPGEVLQWPAGAPSQSDDDGDAGSGDSARKRMATLALRLSLWRKECGAGREPLEAPLDLRALFVDAGPAFGMLCELKDVARASLDRAPLRMRGRAALARALENTAAAELHFQEARRVMLESNLRLVFSVAGKFVNNGIAYDDLVQEGSIGLLRAIEKFEPALGFKFSTYASTWIWQAVTRAIANQRRTVRVPTHIHDKMIRVRGLAAQIEQRTGRAPGLDELAQASGLSRDVVTRALNAANRSLSLDAPVGTGEETSFLDLTADSAQPDMVDSVQGMEVDRIVREAVGALPERESRILNLRLGLDGTRSHTLEEIGAMLGITRERTRQLQNRALESLRSRLKEVAPALI